MCINFYLVRDDEVDTKDQKENVEIIVQALDSHLDVTLITTGNTLIEVENQNCDQNSGEEGKKNIILILVYRSRGVHPTSKDQKDVEMRVVSRSNEVLVIVVDKKEIYYDEEVENSVILGIVKVDEVVVVLVILVREDQETNFLVPKIDQVGKLSYNYGKVVSQEENEIVDYVLVLSYVNLDRDWVASMVENVLDVEKMVVEENLSKAKGRNTYTMKI